MNNSALIVFVRNASLGRVKTRLASTIGDEPALRVYQLLLRHTRSITEHLDCDKFVYYAEDINEDDLWNPAIYQKRMQKGNDLGQRMQDAFSTLFEQGYARIVIIGSDCYQLTGQQLQDAFAFLRSGDAVIGPAMDGGYYLMGLWQVLPDLFREINWSTPTVFKETEALFKKFGHSYRLLPMLNDIDDENDLTAEIRSKADMLC